MERDSEYTNAGKCRIYQRFLTVCERKIITNGGNNRVYNEVIKQLLKKIEILPRNLVVMYLMKMYKISNNMAVQAVYAACRARVCYAKGDNIARAPYVEMDSSLMKKAYAFRLVIEFLPDSQDFDVGFAPWLITFLRNGNLVQVCYIEHHMELATSMMIAGRPVPESEREFIKRIAIVEDTCDIEKIKHAGFSYFCTVGSDFSLKIVSKINNLDAAWEDVPEK